MQTTPEGIFEEIRPISNIVYESLVLATREARNYRYSTEKIDFYLAANIVRHHAKSYLNNNSLEGKYQALEVPNNGLYLRKDDYRIKILKGRDGEPPIENKTYLSKRFFNQIPLPGMDTSPIFNQSKWDVFINHAANLNLILCWHIDEKYQRLILELMCPHYTKGKGYNRSTEVYWRQEVPNPALATQGVSGQKFVDQMTVEFDEDLGEQP